MTRKLTNRELADLIKGKLDSNILESVYNETEIKSMKDVTIKLLDRIYGSYAPYEDMSVQWYELRDAGDYTKASEIITANLFRFAKVVHMMSSENPTPFGLIMREMPELVIGTLVNNVPCRILIQNPSAYELVPIDVAKTCTSRVYSAVSNTNELLAFISSNKNIINDLEEGEQLMVLRGKYI